MTKDDLLARISAERARLEAAVSGLSAERQSERTLGGGWSVKDALAHISFWERACARWLDAMVRDETPERPEVLDVDATNARAYESMRDTTLTDVLAESRASYEGIVSAAALLSDAQMADEQRFGFATWRMIDGNSGEHYREHAEQIEVWIAREPA